MLLKLNVAVLSVSVRVAVPPCATSAIEKITRKSGQSEISWSDGTIATGLARNARRKSPARNDSATSPQAGMIRPCLGIPCAGGFHAVLEWFSGMIGPDSDTMAGTTSGGHG